MIPIVTAEEMRAIDGAASEAEATLIERAGSAVGRAAVQMLGGSYGRVVNVVVGPGNNGADGRVAASWLRSRGVRVRVFEVADCPAVLPPADLVIDAALGTGLRSGSAWNPPDPAGAPVLAVDIPSGLDSGDGSCRGRVLTAERTVTFQALKPGLLIGSGPDALRSHRRRRHRARHGAERRRTSWKPSTSPTGGRAGDAGHTSGTARCRVVAGSTSMRGAAGSVPRRRCAAGLASWHSRCRVVW